MSTPSTPGQNYRDKNKAANGNLTSRLKDLKAKRPDLYRKQVKKLERYRHPDIDPSKLSIPDQISVLAGALGFFLGSSGVPSGVLGDETFESLQTSHSARSFQSAVQSEPFFVQGPHSNLEGTSTSRSAYPIRPYIQNDMFLVRDSYGNFQDRPYNLLDPTSPLSHPATNSFVLQTASGFDGLAMQMLANASQHPSYGGGWFDFQTGETWGTNCD